MRFESTDGRQWTVVHVSCPLCGLDQGQSKGTKRGHYIRQEFRLERCSGCGLVYVNPRVATEEIPLLYNREYYSGNGFDPSVRYDDELLANRWEYQAGADALQAVLGTLTGQTILDVGCGTGAFVRVLQAKGAKASGIDTSESAIAIGRQKGADVEVMQLDGASSKFHDLDAVVLMEVIEHVTDPVAMLRDASNLLRPGGILFVSTGNWNLVSRQPGTPYVMPEGHIAYYTPHTLALALQKAGLDPVAHAKNRFWIGHRLAHKIRMPGKAAEAMASAVSSVAHGYGPFPFGRKPGAN